MEEAGFSPVLLGPNAFVQASMPPELFASCCHGCKLGNQRLISYLNEFVRQLFLTYGGY